MSLRELVANPRPLMTRAEVAAFTGYSVAHLNRLAMDGEGPAYIKGRPCRYFFEDVMAWLQERKTKTA